MQAFERRTQMKLPEGFLVGAATSARQTEGNNVASDMWVGEHLPGSPIGVPSGDACNSFELWRTDMELAANAGLTAYRFGVEWARIEPAEGYVSRAMVLHYAQMVRYCRERGMEPVVTLHHFSSPAWFAAKGGWTAEGAGESFCRYLDAVEPVINAGVTWAVIMNEPNMMASFATIRKNMESRAAEAHSEVAPHYGLPPADPAMSAALLRIHDVARDHLRARYPQLKVGWTVASQVVRALPGGEAAALAYYESIEAPFLRAANGDDFLGVQSYSRALFSKDGYVPGGDEVRRTKNGWEFYPPALGEAIHDAHIEAPDVPILVTENGIATDDDAERVEYTSGALAGMGAAMREGINIRGYLHWSLIDNWEFGSFDPTFGLIAWDHQTFERTAKPSLAWLGSIARTRVIPDAQWSAR
jgi:beta-glucosidase